MPIVRIHGADVEVPRHVHRADGSSKIVWTEEECVAALADGWHAVPPSADALPAEPESVAPVVAETEPEPAPVLSDSSVYGDDAVVDVAPVESAIAEDVLVSDETIVESDTVDASAPEPSDEPPKRKRGRPRKP